MPQAKLDPVLSCLGLAAVAVLGGLASGVGEPRTTVLVFWAVMALSDLTLYILARRVRRMSATPAAARRFWRSVAVAGLIFAFGDSYQFIVTLRYPATDHLTTSGVQSVSALGGAAVMIVVALSNPSGITSRRARARLILDAASIMIAAGVVAWYLVTRLALSGATPGAVVTAVVGAGLLLAGVFTIVRLGLGGNSPMVAAAAAPMIAGSALQGIANIVVPTGIAEFALPVRLVLALAPGLLFALGPRIQELHYLDRVGDRVHTGNKRYSLLPYAAIVVTLGVLIAALQSWLDLPAWGALVGLVLNVSIVIIRQVLALRENEDLLDRLDESLLEITRREGRLESLLRHSSDVTSILDPAGHPTYVSPAVHRVLGRMPDDVLYLPLGDLIHPDDLATVRLLMRDLLLEPGTTKTYECRFRHADGRWVRLEVTATNLIDTDGIEGFVVNARDITEAYQLQEQLRHQATHDPLTGLANRRLFADRIRAIRNGHAAILLLDLNDFKGINDTYGHGLGDQVLLHVTGCLQDAAGPDDLVARFGGDEFAVLVAEGSERAAERVANRFLGALAAPADIAGRSLTVRASVGMVAGRASDAEALLHAADMKMYAQKRDIKVAAQHSPV